MSMNTSTADIEDLSVQKKLADAWKRFGSTDGKGGPEKEAGCEVFVEKTVEEAVRTVRAIAAAEGGTSGQNEELVRVLVTGSMHLVGAALEVLETGEDGVV